MAQYDFFVSYRWGMYSDAAAEMASHARSLGYSVWIDRENPPETTTDAGLAAHLRNGIESCRYVIFFETAIRSTAVVNGPSIREISWQERELGMAEAARLIVLYHS